MENFQSEFDSFETIRQSPPTFSIPTQFKSLNLKRNKGRASFVEIKRLSSVRKKEKSNAFYVDDIFLEKLEKRNVNFKPYEIFFFPPVIWPSDEEKYTKAINRMIELKAFNFILNSPWHIHLVKKNRNLSIWAGPFCNVSNTLAIGVLKSLGFTGVIVSPELSSEAFLQLPKRSPLPLGIITSGYFPFAVSRIVSDEIKENELFFSPKKEGGFVKKYDDSYYIYPAWELDIKDKETLLKNAGYTLFLRMDERAPSTDKNRKRQKSQWNWNLSLL